MARNGTGPKRPRKGKQSGKDQSAAENATAKAGHNKPELSDEEQRALLLQHKGHYQRALQAKKDADAAFKNICKKAKAECGKDAVSDIKDAIQFETDAGKAEFQAELARKHKVARWMSLPVGAEPRFFDDFDGRPAVDVAYDHGKAAGMAGEIAKPPHDPSVPQYQRWLEGWHDGQEILASAFGKLKTEPVKSETKDTTDVSNPPFNAKGDERVRGGADDGLDIPKDLDRRGEKMPDKPAMPG